MCFPTASAAALLLVLFTQANEGSKIWRVKRFGGELAAVVGTDSIECACCGWPVNSTPVVFGAPVQLPVAPGSAEAAAVASLRIFFSWLNADRGGLCLGGQRRPGELLLLEHGAGEAANATQRLLAAGVHAYIGVGSNSYIDQIAPVLEAAGSSLVTGLATNSDERSNVFTVLGSRWGYVERALTFLLSRRDVSRIAIIQSESSDVSDPDECNEFRRLVDIYGGTVATSVTISLNVTSVEFDAAVADMLAHSSHAMVACAGSTRVGARFCADLLLAARRLDFNPVAAFLTGCAQAPEFQDLLGDDARFVFTYEAQRAAMDVRSQLAPSWDMRRLVQELARSGVVEASGDAASTWAATDVLVRAMEVNGSSPEGLLTELRRTDNQTLFGRVVFSATNHNAHAWQLLQFQGSSDDWTLVLAAGASVAAPVIPQPRWLERRCRIMLSGIMRTDTSAWGYRHVTSHYWDRTAGALIGLGAMPYARNTGNASAAAYFASQVIGESTSYQLARAYAVQELLNDVDSGGDSSASDVRLWLNDIIRKVFADHVVPGENTIALDLVQEAAASYYLSPSRVFVCAPCPNGFISAYDIGTGSRRCTHCNSRENEVSVDVGPDKRICAVTCESGQELLPSGSCAPCPKGTYSSDGYKCKACEVGRFAETVGQRFCRRCTFGYISNADASGCEPCPPGYEAGNGARCTPCSPGYHAELNATLTCHHCGNGKYSSSSRATRCENCSAGKHSNTDSNGCVLCEAGRYQLLPLQSSCELIPVGGMQSVTETADYSRFSNKRTYWLRDKSKSRNQEDREDALVAEYCLDASRDCLENQTCGAGSTGVLCMSCLPGYARSEVTKFGKSKCLKCPPFVQNVVVFAAAMLGVIFVSLLIVKAAIESEKSPQNMSLIFCKLILVYLVMIKVSATPMAYLIEERRKLLGEEVANALMFCCRLMTLPSLAPLFETDLMSVTCLMQSIFDEREFSEQLASTLSGVLHSDWFTEPRRNQDFEDVLWRSQFAVLVFWTSCPIVFLVLSYVTSFLLVNTLLCWNHRYYMGALKFYDSMVAAQLEAEEAGRDADLTALMPADEADQWTVYLREYAHRCCALWWMVAHADVRRHGRGIFGLRMFMSETWPLPMLTFLYTYSVIMIGAVRPLFCWRIPSEASSRMLYAHELTCFDTSDKLFRLSISSATLWGLLAPLGFLYYIRIRKAQEDNHSKRSIFARGHEMRSRYTILINGYTEHCYYWEIVLFMLKAVLLCVEAYFHDPINRNTTILSIGVAYGGMCTILQPIDKRCGNVAGRMHNWIVLAWITNCIFNLILSFIEPSALTRSDVLALSLGELTELVALHLGGMNEEAVAMNEAEMLDFALRKAVSPAMVGVVVAMVVLAMFFHVAVLGYILWDVLTFVVESYLAELEEAKADPTLQGMQAQGQVKQRPNWLCGCSFFVNFLERIQGRRMRNMPYACMDSFLGWITVIGNRGDLATATSIPRGCSPTMPVGRPPLSQAPLVPEGPQFRVADIDDVDWLQRALIETMEALASKLENPTFSMSRLEFVMRAGFMIAHSKDSATNDHLLHECYWTDFEEAMDVALAETDIIEHVQLMESKSMRVNQIQRSRTSNKALKAAVSPSGKKKNKKKKGLTRTLSELMLSAFQHAGHKVLEMEVSRRALHSNQWKSRQNALHRKHIIEAVDHMFHPTVFETGVTLSQLQLAFKELCAMPRVELVRWMDLFEKKWLIHLRFRGSRMKRYAGMLSDKSLQAGTDTDAEVLEGTQLRGMRSLLMSEDDMDGVRLDQRYDIEIRSKEVQAGKSFFAESSEVAWLRHTSGFRGSFLGSIARSNTIPIEVQMQAPSSAERLKTRNNATLNWTRFVIGSGRVLHNASDQVGIHVEELATIVRKYRESCALKLDEQADELERKIAEREAVVKEEKRGWFGW